MTEPKPNLDLLRKVLRQIDEFPETWQQGSYAVKQPCGTALCVAGHAVVMSGHKINFDDRRSWNEGDLQTTCQTESGEWIEDLAIELLGLTVHEASDLFYGGNKRENIQRAAEAIAERAGESL